MIYTCTIDLKPYYPNAKLLIRNATCISINKSLKRNRHDCMIHVVFYYKINYEYDTVWYPVVIKTCHWNKWLVCFSNPMCETGLSVLLCVNSIDRNYYIISDFNGTKILYPVLGIDIRH